MGLGVFEVRLRMDTLGPATRSISIVVNGSMDVCDGAHWAFVIKATTSFARTHGAIWTPLVVLAERGVDLWTNLHGGGIPDVFPKPDSSQTAIHRTTDRPCFDVETSCAFRRSAGRHPEADSGSESLLWPRGQAGLDVKELAPILRIPWIIENVARREVVVAFTLPFWG